MTDKTQLVDVTPVADEVLDGIVGGCFGLALPPALGPLCMVD